MKYTTYDKGLDLISNYVDVCKTKYNTTPEITFGEIKPTYFNNMVGQVVEFTVNIKKFDLPNKPGYYIKGRRFIIETNTTYMPDDCETLEDWGNKLNSPATYKTFNKKGLQF